MSVLTNLSFTVEVDFSEIAGWFYGVANGVNGLDSRREQEDDPVFLKDVNNANFQTDTVYLFTYRHELLHPSVSIIPVKFDANGTPLDASAEVGGGPGTGSNGTPNLDAVAKVGNTTTEVLNIAGFSIPDVPDGQLLNSYDGWLVAQRDGDRMRGKLASFLAVLKALIAGLGQNNNAELFAEALHLNLAMLEELKATKNLELIGNNNFIARDVTTLGNFPRGLYFFIDEVLQGSIGKDAEGRIGITSRSGHYLTILEDILTTTATSLIADKAEGYFRTLALATLPRATKTPMALFVPELDTVTGKYRVVAASPAQINDFLIADLLPRIPKTGTSGNQYELAGCFQGNVKADTTKSYPVTPEMVGVWQSHNLQVGGAFIFPTLLDINNKPDSVMEVSFQGNDQWKVSYPEGISSGYAGGKLKLDATL